MQQQQNQQEGVQFPPAKFQQGQKFPVQQFGLAQPGAQTGAQTGVQIGISQFGNIQLNGQGSNLTVKPAQQFVPPIKPQQNTNTPQIPGQVQPSFPQVNNLGGKPQPIVQNPQGFGQNLQNFQKPQVPIFQKPDNNNNNNMNKPTFPPAQVPSFTGMQGNPQFVNKFPQPTNQNIPAPQQKYDPLIVKDECDKMQLVQNFTKYIQEGNFNFAIECLKQIISNDIRVKIKDESKNSN